MSDKAALEAIARAYDKEDATQRGEPDPWRHEGPDTWWFDERLHCAKAAIEALEKVGYRIVKSSNAD